MGLFDDLEPHYDDETRYGHLHGTERREAYERDHLLWKQNQSIQEQIRATKETAKINAETEIKKAEVEAKKALAQQQAQFEHDREMKQAQFEHDKEMRFLSICDDEDFDYDDIKNFKIWLKYISLSDFNNIKYIVEESVKYLTPKNDKNIQEEIDSISEKIDILEKNKQSKQEKLKEIKGVSNKQIAKCTKLFNEDDNSSINKNKRLKIIFIILSFLCWFNLLILPFILEYILPDIDISDDVEIAIIYISVLLAIPFLLASSHYTLNEKIYDQLIEINKIDIDIEKNKKALDTKKKIQEDSYYNLHNSLSGNKKWKKIENKLYECKDLLNSIVNEETKPNEEKFYEFRLNHYNKETEKILKRLEVITNRIDESKVVKNGSKEDYQKYIEEKVSEDLTPQYNLEDLTQLVNACTRDIEKYGKSKNKG